MSEEAIIQKEVQEEDGKAFFDFAAIYRVVVLNWYWFILSIIICLAAAFLYLRYTIPTYNAYAKMLIKDEDGSRRNSSIIRSSATLGQISQNYGIENEMEIIKSSSIAEQAVKDLKLYVTYKTVGRVHDLECYKNQPITVDIDPTHLDKMNAPINLAITRDGNEYLIEGTYYVPVDELSSKGPYGINRKVGKLPVTMRTNAGYLTFNANGPAMKDGEVLRVNITSPRQAAARFAGLSVAPISDGASVLVLSKNDPIPTRAMDYLRQLVICYNRQANEDKNEIAVRTEEFINGRIDKISAELGSTDGAIESFKRANNMYDVSANAGASTANANATEQRLNEANTQIALINEVSSVVNTANKSQLIPNISIGDGVATSLIAEYNKIVLERNRLLRTAAENSPAVEPLTQQLEDLASSIKQSLAQARRSMEIQRDATAAQHGRYTSEISRTPAQERVLTQIGRQQEVKSGLYLTLLQKREENSISLASTADKGRLIDEPKYGGQVTPKKNMTYAIALGAGLLIPSLLLFLTYFFRYRIEGHEDVANLTDLPILADVAVANDVVKTKGDIVVHENKNNQMEEIFRAMRTNLQFMMKENEKVILFTSTTSGEGKTFNAANLAVSFALLKKKVILVGLDIRKPRLAEQFEIDNHHNGITVLLTHEKPEWEDVREQLLPSGVHENLDLLLAGPIPPNPTELVSRPSLEIVINLLREHYDYVIVDTAPVGLVTDTLQIGRVCDVTVYMCRADYTPKSSFDLINGLNYEKKLPNMSVVINGIDMSKKKYGYYYGYGRYGKYGRYGRYGTYGKYGRYGTYGQYGGYGGYGGYGAYGSYGSYSNSRYSNEEDNSVKR